MPTDTDTYDRCNGRLRSNGESPDEKAEPGEWAGEGYCQRPAGEGTSHNGEGRCKLHGGADGIGRPVETGLHSFKREELQETYERALQDEPWGDLRAEIATLRTLYSDFLSRVEQVDQETIDGATKLISELRRTSNTLQEMLHREAPTEEEIQRLITGFANLIESYVPESDRSDAIKELQSIVGDRGSNRLTSGGEEF